MAHSDTAEADFVPPYYSLVQTVGDRVRFRNFDDRNTFAEYASYVESADSRNFVIDFGVKEAWAAFNIGQREMDGLLRSKVRRLSLSRQESTQYMDAPD
jgi:hypothetical protein